MILRRSSRSRVTSVVSTLCLCAIAAGCGGDAHKPANSSPQSSTGAKIEQTAGITPMTPVVLYQPAAEYRAYVLRLLSQLRGQLGALEAASTSGALPAAQHAWLQAHATYLAIGQDDSAYGAFGELGQQIDGLAHGLPGGVKSPHFTGFHRVERDLWELHSTSAATRDTDVLAGLVARLSAGRVAHYLPDTSKALDSWVLRAHEILEDALRDTLSGNDDYGSHSALVTLNADVAATGEMLGLLAPAIAQRQGSIVGPAAADLRAIEAAIAAAGGPRAGVVLSALPLRERQALDARTGQAVETLAPVSELLQIPTTGS